MEGLGDELLLFCRSLRAKGSRHHNDVQQF
jgi:hypothetical protein